MTGLVKEEILTRQAELGLGIENGRLIFEPFLLDPQELLTAPAAFSYPDVTGRQQSIDLEAGSLIYSVCQTPIVLKTSKDSSIRVQFSDGSSQQVEGNILDTENSQHIFLRDGRVHHLLVSFFPGEK
jgi:hypothetical protein